MLAPKSDCKSGARGDGVEGGTALAATAADIDLNPVHAGSVSAPEAYRWCGDAESAAGSLVAWIVSALLATLLISCSRSLPDSSKAKIGTDVRVVPARTGLWLVEYREENGALIFAIFTALKNPYEPKPPGGEGSLYSEHVLPESGDSGKYGVRSKSGEIIPIKEQLYFVSDGNVIPCSERVTFAEFEAFVQSSPENFSTDDLKRFLQEIRRNPGGRSTIGQ